jgi:ribosomal protein S24E
METSITEKKENEMFSRQEVTAEVRFTGVTPSRKELTAEIAKKLSAKPELVSVQGARQLFGAKTLRVTAHVYKTEEELARIEPAHIRERNSGKKKEEAKAEAKK